MTGRLAAAALTVVALGAAAPAAAQDAPPFVGQFVGRWAVEGPRACEQGAGTDDLMLTITARRLEYYASTCNVLSSRRLSRSGNDVHRLKLKCTGEENRTTTGELILAVLEKTDRRPELLVHIDPADWAVRSYQRCGG